VERLALASLPRILAEPDAHLFAVLLSDTQQKPFDVARVGTHPHHIQQPIAAAAIAAELDADRPIRIVRYWDLAATEKTESNDEHHRGDR